jgi:hypothetical protein
MRSDDEDNTRHVRVNEIRVLSAAVGKESPLGPLGLGWMRTCARTVGVIQWLNAAFFGWMTYIYITRGGFYHPEYYGKGVYSPAYLDFGWLFFTTVFGLLCVSGFISRCGLVGLRPWVRRWVATYLGILLLVTAVAIVVEMPRAWLVPGGGLTALMLFATAFAVPSLPFLVEAIVDRMAEAARRPVRREEPVGASVGVWDRSLDG